jgi:hypothetical protein
MGTQNVKGKKDSKTDEHDPSKITSVFRGLKTLFGVAAILLSFWTAMLTAFLIRSSIFIIMYADGYKPDTFTIEKLVFVKGKYTASRAQRSYDKHWAEGTVAGRTEKYSLGGYTQGTINSQEDLDSQFDIGQELAVMYNPKVPKDLELRVLYPEENFRATWKSRQKRMLNTAYLPLILSMGLCLLCGIIARKTKSAIGFCIASLFLVAFSWIPTLLRLL